jgi:hypothetical protein
MGIKSAFSRLTTSSRRRKIRVTGGRTKIMSRAYLVKSANAEATALQPEPYAANAPATVPQAKPVTYRSRVYRYRCEGLEHDEFVYTIVTDTVEEPAQRLPPGDELFGFSGPSPESVREQMKSDREKLGAVEITDWRSFGSL